MNKFFLVFALSTLILSCSSDPNHVGDAEKGLLNAGVGQSFSTRSNCEPSSEGSKGMLSGGESTVPSTNSGYESIDCVSKPALQSIIKPTKQVSTNPKSKFLSPNKQVVPLLSYWIERIGENANIRVSTSTVFHSGEAIRLHVNSRRSGYLYVVNEGSSGRRAVLYPSSSNASELVEYNHAYVIPAMGHIRFDNQSGQETVWLFLSQLPLPLNNTNQNIDSLKEHTLRTVNYNPCGGKDLVLESPESLQSKCGVDRKDLFIEKDA